ncbi:hypothetical protein KSF73_09340 [Burkholderiaceae bacterium DAT-1]|nr:hypothetical protein [Burkholderiaceae bacterium DAT-1]
MHDNKIIRVPMRVVFALSVWCTLSQHLSATTLPRLSVDTLYKHADVVAIVQIESGELVKNGEQSCGVKYSGRIINALKGTFKKDDLINFGPYRDNGIGSFALVFLNESSNVFNPKISTSLEIEKETEYKVQCTKRMPKYSIMHEGFGLLPISWTAKFDYKNAVALKDRWLASPEGIETKRREIDDDRIPSEEYWVLVDDMIHYLKEKADIK